VHGLRSREPETTRVHNNNQVGARRGRGARSREHYLDCTKIKISGVRSTGGFVTQHTSTWRTGREGLEHGWPARRSHATQHKHNAPRRRMQGGSNKIMTDIFDNHNCGIPNQRQLARLGGNQWTNISFTFITDNSTTFLRQRLMLRNVFYYFIMLLYFAHAAGNG
jgi:hypothetical protein